MKQWERTIDNTDYVFIVGTNKEENQDLINKSQPHDLWFHISNQPSCHVVCKINDNTKSNKKHYNKIIKQGAVCCKSHSKYNSLKNVDITYTTIKQLENTNITGTVIVHNSKNITI
jgi:predicted ribosome quality control (RQC) complex YloA/Tae2 family protein